jgi:dTDP-4-dehydrorhamnose 3,5-epimerase
MRVMPSELPDVIVLEPTVHGDDRGHFFESYNRRTLAQTAGIDVEFVQENQSRSVRNVLRGLHYQIRRPQGKLVRVTAGRVFDVAVDLRRGSPRFGKWIGIELSAENRKMAWIPPGFAHGFLALTDACEFLYKATDYYVPEYERSLMWNDPELAVDWPLGNFGAGFAPILSPKDASASRLADAEVYD